MLNNRFWDKVLIIPEHTCWQWVGAIMYRGYGVFYHKGKLKRAHRVSYEVLKGPIPNGMLVCHTCDNRSCVRPEHLFLGTSKDNTLDMLNKGRYVNKRSLKTHCPLGHEYTKDNLVKRATNRKDCKKCANYRCKLYRLKIG